MDHPTISEIRETIKGINTGKAPCLEGTPIEILLYGYDKIAVDVHHLISHAWQEALVPQDWIEAPGLDGLPIEVLHHGWI